MNKCKHRDVTCAHFFCFLQWRYKKYNFEGEPERAMAAIIHDFARIALAAAPCGKVQLVL